MSEELKKGIPLFETTGEIVKRTKEDKERYDKDFEKILKEAGVLKENQFIKEIKHISFLYFLQFPSILLLSLLYKEFHEVNLYPSYIPRHLFRGHYNI